MTNQINTMIEINTAIGSRATRVFFGAGTAILFRDAVARYPEAAALLTTLNRSSCEGPEKVVKHFLHCVRVDLEREAARNVRFDY
jgi:hypothetical protein